MKIAALVLLCLPAEASDTDRTVTLMEAVRSSLAHHTSIAIQQTRIDASKGAVQVAASDFQSKYQASLTAAKADPLASSTSPNGMEFTATRQLRSGVSVTETVGAAPSGKQMGVTLDMPLLRGNRENASAYRERAAISERDAALLDMTQTASMAAARAAAAYWGVRAAVEAQSLADRAEATAAKLIRDSEVLVAADRIPAANLIQMQAELAGRAALSISARQRVSAAWTELALAMGLSPSEFADSSLPVRQFPRSIARTGRLPEQSRGTHQICICPSG